MKTYLLPINVEPDEDGTWFAEVPIIPSCALSCYPLGHVLDSIQDTAQVMLEIMLECGEPLPEGLESYEIETGSEPAHSLTTVTVRV